MNIGLHYRITASRLEEIIFLFYLPVVSLHLEYCTTYGLPAAREILISWRKWVEKLALRKKMLKGNLIALFQYLLGDYKESSAELLSGRN